METGNSEGSGDGELLPRVVADAAAAVIGLPLGPAGSLVTAVTTPLLEAMAHWAWDLISEDRKRRVYEMLAGAWQATGLDATRFARRIGADERTRLITATAVSGAATTTWPPRVAAIGRLLADGLIAEDEAEIDLQSLTLSAMVEMERPHVVLLHLLVNFTPAERQGRIVVQPYPDLDIHSRWGIGLPRWSMFQMAAVREQLRPVLTGLIATLVRHGLAVEFQDTAMALNVIVKGFQQRAQQQAATVKAGSRVTADSLQHHSPEMPPIERTWSPTDLGRRALAYYVEAGEAAWEQPGTDSSSDVTAPDAT